MRTNLINAEGILTKNLYRTSRVEDDVALPAIDGDYIEGVAYLQAGEYGRRADKLKIKPVATNIDPPVLPIPLPGFSVSMRDLRTGQENHNDNLSFHAARRNYINDGERERPLFRVYILRQGTPVNVADFGFGQDNKTHATIFLTRQHQVQNITSTQCIVPAMARLGWQRLKVVKGAAEYMIPSWLWEDDVCRPIAHVFQEIFEYSDGNDKLTEDVCLLCTQSLVQKQSFDEFATQTKEKIKQVLENWYDIGIFEPNSTEIWNALNLCRNKVK